VTTQWQPIEGGYRVSLTDGQYALIDDDDLTKVIHSNWTSHVVGRTTYARRSVGEPSYLHRLIAGDPPEKEVDHFNGDGLDCRRNNLRILTHAENQQNLRISRNSTTGARGVSRTQTRLRNGQPGQTYYRAAGQSRNGRFSKYFPFTPGGLQAATDYARTERARIMPCSAI
jgi:hypothetical protein